MKGLSKVLSIVLILGAVLGFYGGAVNIKDVLACQDYWEEQGEITDENLGKLEDGIAQLEENEEAYVQGVADYEKGQADLAAGKQELAEGKATLTAKTKELNDGKATLAAKTKELNDGKATFASKTKELNQGKATLAASKETIANGETQLAALAPLETAMADYQSGLTTLGYSSKYNEAKDALTDQSSGVLVKIKAYGNYVKQVGEQLINGAASMEEGQEKTAQIKKGESLKASGQGLIDNVNEFSTNQDLVAAPVGGFAKRLDSSDSTSFTSILTSLNNASVPSAGDYLNLCNNWFKNKYTPINPTTSAYATLQASGAGIVGNILDAGLITDAEQKAALSSYRTASNITAPEVILKLSSVFTQVQQGIDAKKQELADGKAQVEAAEKTIADGEKQLAAAGKTIADGEVQLAAGEKKIADGEKQLAAGKVTLANGEATVADGEKQLAEGEAKLAEYEDGEAQLMAGLDTLLASETYSGLKSIKARLGKNFSYMQDNNKNLDLEKASLAVQTGRDFSADSSVKITKEIKTRAIGQGVGLFGAVLALVAGIVGLSKKNKTAGILALLAAVSAIAGIVVFNGAGFEMSEIAGSTLTGMSAIYAMVVVAVAGVLGGIAHLSIKKDAE